MSPDLQLHRLIPKREDSPTRQTKNDNQRQHEHQMKVEKILKKNIDKINLRKV